MTDLQIYLLGLLKVIKNFWPVFLYLIIMVPRLRRWEKDEAKKLEKAIERDKLKREYHQEHTASRN